MNNKELIYLFKEKFKIKTTEEVGFILNQAATNVSAWQNEKKPMPISIKFRLLEHIDFSPETKKFASLFVDIDEQDVLMVQDHDRLEELKRRQAGIPVNFADQKWIERVESLQTFQGLNDMQTATQLEMKIEELAEVKSGHRELRFDQKVLLLGLLAVKSAVNKETLKRKLNKRIEQN